jgi:hypothetical protein
MNRSFRGGPSSDELVELLDDAKAAHGCPDLSEIFTVDLRPSPAHERSGYQGVWLMADRPTGRQADRPTGRQADRPTGRQADRPTGRQADDDPIVHIDERWRSGVGHRISVLA